MGVVALLAGLVTIIVVLGFVTSLQNRFTKPGRGRKRNPQPFEDEFNAEERQPSRHHKKNARHYHENGSHRHDENDAVQQQVGVHRKDR